MTDHETVETYRSVADEYRERNADRSVVDGPVERFLAAVEETADGGSARVVDVGCGPGWESETFAARGHDVLGVDLMTPFLRTARAKAPGASVVRMDMRRLGLAPGFADGLWVCASFLHVPREDAPAALSGFHRVLRPGGVLHLSVQRGDGERVGGSYDGDRRRFTLYRPDELRTLVADAGLSVESVDVDGSGEWVRLSARA